jgi:hypothetical protein
MLSLHFHRRRLRHTARVTLVAWLWALTAGVVNACALTPPGGPGVAVTWSSSSAHDEGHGGFMAEAEHAAHPGHEHDAGKAGCLEFCADESSALTKGKVSPPDMGVPVLVSSIPTRDLFVQIANIGTRLSLEGPAAQGSPLVVRLLRLNL